MVCENCLHRFVCEYRYAVIVQYGCKYHKCKENIIITELEKIKAEIKTLRYGSDTYKHAIDDVFEILDNRISELKGE